MKILFVTYDLPYPLDAGGKVRAYNLIKELAKENEVTLFSYYRDNSQLSYVDELRKYCANVHLFKRVAVFSLKHIVNTILHPNLTAHISHYYHSGLSQELDKELKTGIYDLLHLESFYTSHLLGDYNVTQVLGTENIEWKIYQGHFEMKSFTSRFPLQLEAFRTRMFEQSSWKKADALLAVCLSDKATISEHTTKSVYEIPNGVDIDYFCYESPTIDINKLKLLYVGDYAYIQNSDAISWLLKDIYPAIRAKYPNSTLTIVGKNIPENLEKSYGVTIRRDVEDIREVYSDADMLLAPLRISSGTQFKILEAMATGVIVLTTPTGIQGLNAKPGKELVVFKDKRDVALAIENILKSQNTAEEMSKRARELVEKEYSWNMIGSKLRSIYKNLVK
ncbi:MAG: glycosyltransferase family 4 protein [bacterium]|nr:glycosyltransferase family 4 protein [bacterium]